MCGVYFYTKKVCKNDELFKKNLLHRGPDYQNQITIDNFVIGHTLLSIRDKINSSKQPVLTRNNYYFSFNGEIYNSKEILNRFKLNNTVSDTQILKQLIEKIGLKFINYIKGMYAIVLYDSAKKEICLYKDHSGQKNLYYYVNNKEIIISSEIYPITKTINFDCKVNFNYLSESLILGHPQSNKTIFSKIFKLLPGEMIKLDQDGYIIQKIISDKDINLDFQGSSIYECIDKTIENHTLSNSKVGINLSSGLDSNIVLYHALKHKSNLEIFSTNFENADNKYNIDFFGAKEVANFHGIKFNETLITKNDYENNFIESFSNIEEINRNIGNPTYLTNYKNQRKNNFKTILSGDGGDEIFVGYNWYFKGRKREKILKYLSNFFGNYSFYLFLYNYYSQFNRYNSFKNKTFFKNFKKINFKIYNDIFINQNFFVKKNFSKKIYNFDTIKLFLDQYLWLPNEILIRADKLGMSQSLEVRNPFCDQDLRKKLLNEINKNDFTSNINKKKIRDIYESKLPNFIFNNNLKYGWTTPRDWIVNKKIVSIISDLIPSKSNLFNWIDFKNQINTNNELLLDRSIYPIISLLILNNEFKLNL